MNPRGKSGPAGGRARAPRRRGPRAPVARPRRRAAGGGEAPGRLIEATLRCLREKGLARTTSRDIARAAGTNLQAITYHFGSKDELVSQALLSAIREWTRPALRALRSGDSPPLRLLAALQALQDSFERAGDLLPAYLQALVEASRAGSLRRGVSGILRELRAFLVGEIDGLKSSGFLPAWIDPEGMATLLLATADGVALHAALDPASVDHHAVSAQAMQLLLAASAARPSP
ncbi:MAG: TetR/AcrR family transcriptional regulator [Acidobacteria bacterium]|nr:TetR/AcrR family transcriptional regulator [Acidobacteriota bacterium]